MASENRDFPGMELPPDAVLPQRAPNAPGEGTWLPMHFKFCMACGDQAPGGLRIRIRAMEGLAVRAQFTVLAVHQGAPGLIHGGLLSAAIDEAMGSLAYLLMTPAVTGRLEVDFRRPIPVGAAVVIDARVIAQHGRKVYTSADVSIEEESATVAVGRGAGLFVQVPLEHFTRHGTPEFVSEAQQDRTEAFARWAVNP